MSEKRFDIIYDCQGVTRLIDRENKLISLDFGFDWNDLDDYEKDKVREWLVMLNEQQDHITHLEDTNDNFRIKLIEDIEVMEQAEKKIGEQQATIEKLKEENEQLRKELQKKQEEEKLYAQEIVKLNKEAKEVLNFKELGGDY